MTADYEDLKAKAADVARIQVTRQADTDRAVAQARETTAANVRAEERARHAPRLVDPAIKSALGNHIDDARLAVILEPLDRTKLLTADGDVDTDKVVAFVAGIGTTATRATSTSVARFPNLGQGRRGDLGKVGPSVQSGRDAYTARHQHRDRR